MDGCQRRGLPWPPCQQLVSPCQRAASEEQRPKLSTELPLLARALILGMGTEGGLRHQENIQMGARNRYGGAEVLRSRAEVGLEELLTCITSHQSRVTALWFLQQQNRAVRSPSFQSSLASRVSGSSPSLGAHRFRLHSLSWTPLGPISPNRSSVPFLCLLSVSSSLSTRPTPLPCSLFLCEARPAACHPFINAFEL